MVRLKGSHGPLARVNCGLDSSPGYRLRVPRPLVISACRTLCAWDITDEMLDDEPVFACSGCGSEWVTSEPWTPIDSDGFVPDAVQVERRRGRG